MVAACTIVGVAVHGGLPRRDAATGGEPDNPHVGPECRDGRHQIESGADGPLGVVFPRGR